MSSKSIADRQFELLDKRLINLHDQIATLQRKVECGMSELSDAVKSVADDVSELQAAQQRVIDLLNRPNPDVSAAIAALQNADAGFDAVTKALNDAADAADGGATGGVGDTGGAGDTGAGGPA
jgi:chromosome segregation ATPase